jgi:hypothetical protein
MSFQQERTVDKACTFELDITYVPTNFDDDSAMLINRFLLSNVKKPIYYRYGYKTSSGGLALQNVYYRSNFTTYDESFNETHLTYKLKGISEEVQITVPKVCVSNYINSVKKRYEKIQPSCIAYNLVHGFNGAQNTGIDEYFKDYEIIVKKEDCEVYTRNIHIQDGALHDVFFGKINSDGTALPNGLVNLSNSKISEDELLSLGLVDKSTITRAKEYEQLNVSASSYITDEQEKAYNTIQNLSRLPFVCYFDNAISSIDSYSLAKSQIKGTFYYGPKYTRAITNVFNYNFGNTVIDSDVLSFNVSYDCTTAIAMVPAEKEANSDIDIDGEAISGNETFLATNDFVVPTFNTVSGFNESAFLSVTTVSNYMNFPIEATMTILGQTDTNSLLDKIQVNIFVNGAFHEFMSGEYVIQGITDNLDDNGFTTTFKLSKLGNTFLSDNRAKYENNFYEGTKAWDNQQACANDFV